LPSFAYSLIQPEQRKFHLLCRTWEVFTAVAKKKAVFCDKATCWFNISRRFGGTCRFHLKGIGNNASEEKC
jgi:hypothetical protein